MSVVFVVLAYSWYTIIVMSCVVFSVYSHAVRVPPCAYGLYVCMCESSNGRMCADGYVNVVWFL